MLVGFARLGWSGRVKRACLHISKELCQRVFVGGGGKRGGGVNGCRRENVEGVCEGGGWCLRCLLTTELSAIPVQFVGLYEVGGRYIVI